MVKSSQVVSLGNGHNPNDWGLSLPTREVAKLTLAFNINSSGTLADALDDHTN